MNWKMRGRVFGLGLLAVNFVAANAGYSVGPAQASVKAPTIKAQSHIAALTKSQILAQGQFSQFLDHVLHDDENGTSAIKIALPQDGGTEILVWVKPTGLSDDRYSGTMVPDRNAVGAQVSNASVAFDVEQVRDWSFIGKNGKMYGNYLTREMLPDMAPKTARQIALVLAPTPVPAHW